MSSGKHSSSKKDRRGSSGSKSHRFKESTTSRSRPSQSSHIPFSFLFVVNDLNYSLPDNEVSRDDYLHRVPPRNSTRYTPETPSKVMRYSNGVVSEAQGYVWSTDGRDTGHRALYSGRLCDQQGRTYISNNWRDYWEVAEYSRAAVFACNPFLPIMVSDEDPMLRNVRPSWQLLQLFHPPHLSGITQVAFEDTDLSYGPGLVRYIAGLNASWMPALLPTTYQRPVDGPPSRGLGGELPIILGLMALSEPPGHTNAVFLGGNGTWRGNVWTHNRPPRGYPNAARDEQPRGVLSAVFLDPENTLGSTRESIRSFEWDSVVVRG